jgi:ABC-type multidrug transport system fused ATPase/permease subunit
VVREVVRSGKGMAAAHTMLSFAAPHKATIAGASVLGLLGALAALAQPLAVGSVLGAVRTGGSVAGPAALLAVLFALDAIFSGLRGYLLGRTGEGVVLGIRQALIGSLLRLPVSEHDRHRAGDLLSRVGTDTTLLKVALADSLTGMLVGAVVFVGALVLMAAIDALLLMVALVCVAVAAAVVFLVASRVRTATEEAQESVGSLSAALERSLRAIRTVKISRAEAREEGKITTEARSAYEAGVRVASYEALVGPATNVALQGSFVLVLGVGGARLATGDLVLEDLVAFLLYLLYLVTPIVMVFVSFAQLQQGLAAVGRIREVLRLPEEGGAASTAERGVVSESTDAPVARFDRVSFGYAPGRPVLKDISFEIYGPGLTALVGPSGAGKSTVFSLLSRFYDAGSGVVEVGGRDVRGIPLNELRGSVAYVEQEAPVLAGTVRENLLYARPDATDEELREALNLINLHSFVERLPEGLETGVGDDGSLLSGGERQRIALARMLLLRPRLLLLDEVTSQLDAANEKALKETIARISKRCAVVVIAHRLSTVVGADKIVLLDDGAVVAEGAHEDLVEKSALYKRLIETQMLDAGMGVKTWGA